MRIFLMRGVLPAVLILFLALSSAEASADKPSLCGVLAKQISNQSALLIAFSSQRIRASEKLMEMVDDEAAYRRAEEESHQIAFRYSEVIQRLESLLVIRRELGCPK